MTTLTTTRPSAGFARSSAASPAWRAAITRFVEWWKQRRDERNAERLDRHYRGERNRHERYLSRARDVYELERLERDWQRRHLDLWRVY